MDEKKLLEGFAKALGSAGEKALKDIEEKKLKEQKYLEGLASMLGPEAKRKLEEIENEQAEKKKALEAKKEEIRAKKEKEQRLLDEINKSLTALVTGNPQYIKAIEQEVAETIAELPIEETIAAAVEETVAEVIEEAPVEEIEENAAQPQPELPKDDIITLAVKDISKSAPGKIQDVVDELPRGLRRELDILKKSIADLHRFATNHSQMGGGGEVKLARLDDVDASTIEDGYYLQYDAASGKFIFAAGGGGGGTGPRGANGISITNAAVNGNGYLIITYSNSATSNAGYVVGATGPTGANGANGVAGANGANGTNGNNGTDGIGISSATVNGDGYLTITYSNTYVANAGYVVGPAGSGNGGVSQIQSNWTQTNNTAVDFIKNKPYVPTNTDIETAYNNAVAYAASNTYVNSTFATNTYVNGTFQTMSGLSANVATLAANAATYLNGKTESNLNVNNALTSNNASYLGGNTASDLRTYASDLAGNAYSNAIAYAASNSTVYSTFATNTYVNSTFQTMAGLSANVATLAANASTYLNGKTESNLNVNNSFTSNNASYLGGNTALDLRAYSDTAAGIAYSNAISYAASNNAVYSTFATNTYVNSTFATNTYVNSTFATNTYVNDTFQTMAGLSANVAKLSANAATYLNGKTEPNLNVNNALTSNNASYLNGNTASDILTYVDNKSGNAYTNATAFSSNASNISSGTVGEPRLPYRMDQNVRTTDAVSFGNMTITGNLTVTGNVAVIGANNLTVVDNMIYLNSNNTVTNPDLGFAGNYNDGSYHHAGFFRDATDGFWKVFDNYAPEPDASPYIDTSNNTFHIADFHANTFRVGNTTVYSTINSTAFSGSANSASYLGGNTASDLRTYTDNKSGNAFSNAVSTMIANSTSYTGNNTFGGTTTTFNSNIVFNGTFTIDGGTF